MGPEALRVAGVDVVTMANNHSLDYGRTGLANTLADRRSARFPVVGIGANASAAWAPYRVRINGVRIAILGVSDVAELASSWVATGSRSGEAHAINLARTLAAVRAARRSADVVIVCATGRSGFVAGPARSQRPRPWAVEAGADGVLPLRLHAARHVVECARGAFERSSLA